MLRVLKNIPLYFGIALTVIVSCYSLRYLFDGAEAVDALSQTDAFLAILSGREDAFWRDFSTSQRPLYHLHEFAVVGHVSAASIALLTGIFQFTPFLGRARPLLHRASGYLYAFSAVLGLALGAYISVELPMVGGLPAIITNVGGGILGIAFVAISFVCIWKKQYLKHGQWMLRSYAILMTILTVYLLIAMFSLVGLGSEQGYGLAHLLCFPINLIIAEIFIRKYSLGFFEPKGFSY